MKYYFYILLILSIKMEVYADRFISSEKSLQKELQKQYIQEAIIIEKYISSIQLDNHNSLKEYSLNNKAKIINNHLNILEKQTSETTNLVKERIYEYRLFSKNKSNQHGLKYLQKGLWISGLIKDLDKENNYKLLHINDYFTVGLDIDLSETIFSGISYSHNNEDIFYDKIPIPSNNNIINIYSDIEINNFLSLNIIVGYGINKLKIYNNPKISNIFLSNIGLTYHEKLVKDLLFSFSGSLDYFNIYNEDIKNEFTPDKLKIKICFEISNQLELDNKIIIPKISLLAKKIIDKGYQYIANDYKNTSISSKVSLSTIINDQKTLEIYINHSLRNEISSGFIFKLEM